MEIERGLEALLEEARYGTIVSKGQTCEDGDRHSFTGLWLHSH